MNQPLAQTLRRAIECGDKAAMREVYSPDAKFWHNTDGVAVDLAQSLAATEAFIDRFSDRRFDDVVALFAEDATLSLPDPPEPLKTTKFSSPGRGGGAKRSRPHDACAWSRTSSKPSTVGKMFICAAADEITTPFFDSSGE